MLQRFTALYALLIATLFLCIATLEPILFLIYEEEVKTELAMDYQGVYVILEALHPHLDAQEMQTVLARTKQEANTAVAIRSLQDWDLPPDAIKVLQQGQTWVESIEEQILYRQVSPDIIARIGPMLTSDNIEGIDTIHTLILLGIFAFVTFLWSLWLHIRLQKLEQSCLQLSLGALDTKAPTGLLSVGSLNRSFNLMAERLKRLFDSHRYLTNAVSHELRSPITRVRFQLEMLANAKSEHTYNKHLQGIASDIDDMDELVEEILSYSRMERTESILNLKPFAIKSWLEKQVAHLQLETKLPIVLLPIEYDGDVYADSYLLARLLRNLVTNADRFSNSYIHVGFTFHAANAIAPYALWVDDDGPGIAPEHRERIFEPFVRLEQSRNKAYGGYGLGLAIVSQIARQHQGQIRIQDSPDKGARFVLTWAKPQAT